LQRKQQILDKGKHMSQFTLTPEEDAIITDALRAKATQYTAMFGVADPALEALIVKLDSYNPAPVVVEEAPVVEEVVEVPADVVEPTEEVVEVPADVVEPTEEEVEAHFADEEAE
jgi:hypothetical protein